MIELGKICDVRDGTHDSPKYVSDGYPLITSKNLKDGFIDFTDANLISRPVGKQKQSAEEILLFLSAFKQYLSRSSINQTHLT